MAEIVGVSTRFTVAVDVAAMERESASEYGHGWTVASLLALVGDLLERGYGSVLYRELMAVRELSRESLEQAQGQLGPHAALVRSGLSSVDLTEARRIGEATPGAFRKKERVSQPDVDMSRFGPDGPLED